MIDIKELKTLAEAANPNDPWYKPGDLRYADDKTGEIHGVDHHADGFIAAANPAAVLELIAEIQRLRETPANQLAEAIVRTVVQGAAAGVQSGIMTTVQQLREENEALRKDAERYQWLRGDISAGKVDLCVMRKHWHEDSLSEVLTLEEADQQIDAAMSKEQQP